MVWRQFGAIFTASEYLALFLALLATFLALLSHFDLAALIAVDGRQASKRRCSFFGRKSDAALCITYVQ